MVEPRSSALSKPHDDGQRVRTPPESLIVFAIFGTIADYSLVSSASVHGSRQRFCLQAVAFLLRHLAQSRSKELKTEEEERERERRERGKTMLLVAYPAIVTHRTIP